MRSKTIELVMAAAIGFSMAVIPTYLLRDGIATKRINDSGLPLPHPKGEVRIALTYEGAVVPNDRATALLLDAQGFKMMGKNGQTAHIVVTQNGQIVPPEPCAFSMDATTTRRGNQVSGEQSLTLLTTSGASTTVLSVNASGTLQPDEAGPDHLEETITYSSSAGWSPDERRVDVTTSFEAGKEAVDVAAVAAQTDSGVVAQRGYRQVRDLTPPEPEQEPEQEEQQRVERDYLKPFRWIPGLKKKKVETEPNSNYDNGQEPESEDSQVGQEEGLVLDVQLPKPMTELEVLIDSLGTQNGFVTEDEAKAWSKLFRWGRDYVHIGCANGDSWAVYKKVSDAWNALNGSESESPKYSVSVNKEGRVMTVWHRTEDEWVSVDLSTVSVDYRRRSVTSVEQTE